MTLEERRAYDKARYHSDPKRRADMKRRASLWTKSEKGKAWKQRVIERTRAKDRDRSKRQKPRRLAYYQKNRSIIRAKAKAFRLSNLALCKAWDHAHRMKNRGKRQLYNRQYQKANAARLRVLTRPLKMAYNVRRKTMEQASADELHAIKKFIRDTLKLPFVVCTYCGSTTDKPHFDHRIPLARGGKHALANLCVACGTCNCSKSDKTPEEFEQYRKEANALWQVR